MQRHHAIAPAKVNLFLHVLGRRADGYHELSSLVVFTEFGDELEVCPDQGAFSALITGPNAGALDTGDSPLSIERAAVLLGEKRSDATAGFAAILTKNIPVAAGLGGGSSDAAAALRLLNELWKTGLSDEQLETLGLSIGADVPVCLRARPTIVSGIGEELRDAARLPQIHLVLGHTGIALPTQDVFGALERTDWSEDVAVPQSFETVEALVDFLERTRNDLEVPAVKLQPEIAALLSDLRGQPGCMLARMSGSGAACFGLFASEIEAFAASERLSGLGWWAVATRLL